MKWPDVLLYPASPTQAGCECAMGFLAAASGGAPPMLAEPRQHAAVLQHTPHPRRTPTNVFSKALAFEARLCESAPVSRVPRKRRRHRQNAERVSAGLKGPLPEAGPSLAGVFWQRTEYNTVCLRDVAKTTRPHCPRCCYQPLGRGGARLDGTGVGRVSPITQKAKPLMWNSRIVASTSQPLDQRR